MITSAPYAQRVVQHFTGYDRWRVTLRSEWTGRNFKRVLSVYSPDDSFRVSKPVSEKLGVRRLIKQAWKLSEAMSAELRRLAPPRPVVNYPVSEDLQRSRRAAIHRLKERKSRLVEIYGIDHIAGSLDDLA